MGPFEMVVAIVLIVTIGKIYSNRHKNHHSEEGNEDRIEAGRLRQEVHQLKERVQVLERVITDQRESSDLSLEIEKLRNS